MSTYRIAATVPPNGLLELSALPFQPGERVEVTVRLLPVKNGESPQVSEIQQGITKRVRAIRAIQSGKYVKTLSAGESLASDEFAKQKQTEQTQEERRWHA